MDYPRVWPAGGLFAFSGWEGETSVAAPFLAFGRDDGLGWNFELTPRTRLLLNAGSHRLYAWGAPGDYVFPDCWHCITRAGEREGAVDGAFLDQHTMAVRVAFDMIESPDTLDLYMVSKNAESTDSESLATGDGWWLAVAKSPRGAARRFGVAISYESAADAHARAAEAMVCDLDAVLEQRRTFYDAIDAPESIMDARRRCYYRAVGVLKANVEGAQSGFASRFPVARRGALGPCRASVVPFAAAAWQLFDPAMAAQCLRATFSREDGEGRIPAWSAPGIPDGAAGLGSPPLFAWAVAMMQRRAKGLDVVKEFYPRVVRHLTWCQMRRRREDGLYAWRMLPEETAKPGHAGIESAMEGSPRFDHGNGGVHVDFASYVASEYTWLKGMAKSQHLDDDYTEWNRRWERLRDAANAAHWDDEDNFYYDLDGENRFVPVKTTSGLLALLGRFPDRDQAEALRMHLTHPKEFRTSSYAASVALDEDAHARYGWRGGVWPHMNALLYHGLKAYGFHEEAFKLADHTIALVARWCMDTGCLFDYYDPDGSEAPDAIARPDGGSALHDPLLTAAAYLHLVHEVYDPA